MLRRNDRETKWLMEGRTQVNWIPKDVRKPTIWPFQNSNNILKQSPTVLNFTDSLHTYSQHTLSLSLSHFFYPFSYSPPSCLHWKFCKKLQDIVKWYPTLTQKFILLKRANKKCLVKLTLNAKKKYYFLQQETEKQRDR